MTPLTIRDEPFERVSGEWEGLLAQCAAPVPFVTPAWQRVWLSHFLGDRKLMILTAREGERLVGLAPLLIDGDRAELVGHYSICDYMDVLVTPGFETSFFNLVFERLSSDGISSVDLRGILESSPTAIGAPKAAAPLGYGVEQEDEALSPSVELPPTWDDYLGSLSKKDRHELRRKLRRLESAGGSVELRVVREQAEATSSLDTLFHLMRISSHHKEEFLDRPGMQDFFREITAVMAAEGMLRFYFLTFDGQAVASVMNFDLGGRLYMYNSGYDPDYSHYAVGLMSKTLLIKDAIENGRTRVDFLRGDESYKYDLGGKDQRVFRIVLKK